MTIGSIHSEISNQHAIIKSPEKGNKQGDVPLIANEMARVNSRQVGNDRNPFTPYCFETTEYCSTAGMFFGHSVCALSAMTLCTSVWYGLPLHAVASQHLTGYCISLGPSCAYTNSYRSSDSNTERALCVAFTFPLGVSGMVGTVSNICFGVPGVSGHIAISVAGGQVSCLMVVGCLAGLYDSCVSNRSA